MEFRNHTPFPAQAFDSLDQRDTRFHTVVMRLTFELQGDGTLAFAPEQTPLVATDEYFGEPNQSSVKQESDFAPYKPHTDVIVSADACAPGGQAVRRFAVGIKITGAAPPPALPPRPYGLNPMQAPSQKQLDDWQADVARLQRAAQQGHVLLDKQLVVTGARAWRKRSIVTRALSLFMASKWTLSTSAPMHSLPLRYEYAYGGDNKILVTDRAARRVKKKDRLPPQANDSANAPEHVPAIAHTVYPMNPVGRGFADPWYVKAAAPDPLPAPQIERPGETTGEFGKSYTPAGLGVITRAWQPRLPLAGTYDRQWLEQRHPYLPFDFNFAYWNAAPADQQIAPHLDGDESVTLTNLCAPDTPGATRDASGNSQLTFQLPGHLPFVLVRFEDGPIGELAAKLDTLLIDTAPDAADPGKKPTVTCVWRATVAGAPAVRVLEARMLGRADIAALKAQTGYAPVALAQQRSPHFA